MRIRELHDDYFEVIEFEDRTMPTVVFRGTLRACEHYIVRATARS